jgi:hypothetical protein
METAIRRRAASKEYDAITSGPQLAEKLTADLRAVSRDKHLSVMYLPEGARDESAGGPSAEELKARRDWKRSTLASKRPSGCRATSVIWKSAASFLLLWAARPPRPPMSFLAHTDALIIDLRRNGGGEPAMIAYVLSYLFDEPTHLNDIYERVGDKTQQWWTMPHVPGQRFGAKKPVYVLRTCIETATLAPVSATYSESHSRQSMPPHSEVSAHNPCSNDETNSAN